MNVGVTLEVLARKQCHICVKLCTLKDFIQNDFSAYRPDAMLTCVHRRAQPFA